MLPSGSRDRFQALLLFHLPSARPITSVTSQCKLAGDVLGLIIKERDFAPKKLQELASTPSNARR